MLNSLISGRPQTSLEMVFTLAQKQERPLGAQSLPQFVVLCRDDSDKVKTLPADVRSKLRLQRW